MRKHLEIMSIFSRNGVIQLPGDKLCEKQQLWSYGSLIKIPPSRLYSGEEIFFIYLVHGVWRISVFDGVKLPWCICVAIETYLIRYFHCFRGVFFLHGLVSVLSLNWSNMHILNRLHHVYTYIHIYLLEKQYIPQSFNISKNKMMYKNMFSKQKILIACFSIIIKIREVFLY